MTTQPSVSTEIAPDEQEMFDTSSGGFGGDETGAMSDPEAGDDDYDECDQISYEYLRTLGLETTTVLSLSLT